MNLGQQPKRIKTWKHISTTNKSFRDMHLYLKEKGIKNNAFMLLLYDNDLASIDPHDEKLNTYMKQKVLRECMINPWYFFREVVRIPDQGVSTGVKFQLHRGNMALLYCLILNFNIYLEMPRQLGKTVSALAWYLYCFNFGTANSNISFLNKKLDNSKENLSTMRDIRDLLPKYLQLSEGFSIDGKKIKASTTVETLQHPINNNKIKTVPSARNRTAAASLLRGKTSPIIYADEFAFMLYNKIIYTNMVPAFNTASNNAKKNNKPHGILITSTPGLLTDDEGMNAFNMKEAATPFSELWYDLSYNELMGLMQSNTNSSFVYIKYNYLQLGKDEAWFKDICVKMEKDWDAIRREILLEWSQTTENSPFKKEDLEMAQTLTKQPISTILLLNKYTLNIYEKHDPKYPPIIGVDVSGGFNRDASAITIIDTKTTKVVADLNCNYISTVDLAKCIYELVVKYLPNAVVNVERNGGFGASVLSQLVNTSIKKNLYYEIQDKVLEERFNGVHISRKTQKVKVYGSDSTHTKREMLMELLSERMEYHKDKIISPIIINELKTLEVKRTGRIEHSAKGHDDAVFSWLWALYVYYHGKDLRNTFGIIKKEIFTDQNLEEAYIPLEEKYSSIVEHLIPIQGEDIVSNQINEITKNQGIQWNDWVKREQEKDEQFAQELLMTQDGKEAYANMYNCDISKVPTSTYQVPISVFSSGDYDDTSDW